MVDKKIDEKAELEFRKIYNRYFDKRKENMNSTKFKLEDVISYNTKKDNTSRDQKKDLIFCWPK